jgi:hypothetical protein
MTFAVPISTETGFVYPANMKHESSSFIGFGDKNIAFLNRCHLANDYNIAENSPVYAVTSGTVERANNSIPFYGSDLGGLGSAMVIKHLTGDGVAFYALYGHIKNIKVNVGDSVVSGEKIAEVGRFISGGRNIPHLHFGINTIEPSYHGYTPTTACNEFLGFVDPEQFMESNKAPKKTCDAVDDRVTTLENTLVTTSNVLNNDTASNIDNLVITTYESHSQNGVAIISEGDGSFTYTPAINFTGTDSFAYSVADNKGCTDTAMVSITINKPASTPTPTNPSTTTSSGGGSLNPYGLMGLFLLLCLRLFRK